MREIMASPHCSQRVIPMADGLCPACRRNVAELPGPADSSPNSGEEAWSDFEQSATGAELPSPIRELLATEAELQKTRSAAIRLLWADCQPDEEIARRIELEILPNYEATRGALPSPAICRKSFWNNCPSSSRLAHELGVACPVYLRDEPQVLQDFTQAAFSPQEQ